MGQRFEAFKEEYEALCKKYGVYLTTWHDGGIAFYDLDPSRKWATAFLEITNMTLLEITNTTRRKPNELLQP